jgi:magnesium transporter
MRTELKNKKTTWVNLLSPTTEEIADLQKKFDLHPLIVAELKQPTLRSKVDIFGETIYLILHFPIFDLIKRTCSSREIDFVLGKNFLITVHYDAIETIDRVYGDCDIDESAKDRCLGAHSGQTLFSILKPLYDFSLRELDQINKRITRVEEKIFSGKERETVKEISLLRREILDFSRILHTHQYILTSLEKAGEHFFPKDYHHYLAYISGEFYKLWNTLANYKETVGALEETNNSLLSTQTNEIMKTLTVMAFMLLPLTLVASIFGMNAVNMPIIGNTFDFWIILAIMAIFSTFIYFIFRRFLHWI